MKKGFLKLCLMLTLSSGLFLTACNNQPKDSKIASDFGDKAKTNPQLLNVTASVNEGVLTLTGQCPDESCRSSAEQAAREVKGVKSVVNNIQVTPATAPVVIADDATLKNSVDDVVDKYDDVDADVQNGEVILRGSIKRDDLQKLMMDLNALNPKKVTNQLTVK
jgi:hyperosmotically inducible periplasmic protein